MTDTWVLVADNSRARIFLAETPRGPLQELETLAHPESRLHPKDITSDQPGRTFDSFGLGGRHAKEAEVDPKQHEALFFAKQVSERLEKARLQSDLKQLVIVAAPAFLGLLRKHLSAGTQALVTYELDKDITQQRPEEIRQHLPEQLPQLGA